jgi:hypothetical protein
LRGLHRHKRYDLKKRLLKEKNTPRKEG